MKKITLALSALMLSAGAAMAVSPGESYVIIPADAPSKYLSVDPQGKVAYATELGQTTLWDYTVGEQDENFNVPKYLKNGDKFLSLTEEGPVLADEPSLTFVSANYNVEGAYTISNYSNFWYPSLPEPYLYLNAAALVCEPEATEATAFYFIEATTETTPEEIEAAMWYIQHPEAMVIAVGGETAREKGKYLSVTAEGRLITSNTLDMNAVWERGFDDESGEMTISNLGVKGYLYTGNGARNMHLSETVLPIYMVESPELIGAWGLTTTADAKAADYVFLNALNTQTETESGGIGTWNLDAGSSFFFVDYNPEMTAEEIDGYLDELIPVAAAKKSVLANATKYMNASAAGRSYGESDLIAIENAETEEELNEAAAAAMQKAIFYAEMTMQTKFLLRSNSNNAFIANVDNATKPLQRAAANLDCLWIAEFLNDDVEPTADATYEFKSFKLRNVSTGKYMGLCPGYSQAMPVADEAGAAVMQLHVSNNGFAIIQTNNELANAYVNLSTNPSAPELTVWSDANDANGMWTFEEMPSIATGNAWLSFSGKSGIDPFMGDKIYYTVDGVEVIMPEGTVATGLGKITFGKYGEMDPDTWDRELVTLQEWSGEEIAKLTPVVKEVEKSYFDPETFSYVTEKVNALVYTLPLTTPVTELNELFANAEEYMFKLVDEDQNYFSRAMEAYASMGEEPEQPEEPELIAIAVEPAAGEVKSLTQIYIDKNGEHGWACNSESTEKVTLTFNGNIANDAAGRSIDCNVDQMTERYDKYDMSTFTPGGWEIDVNFTEAGKYVLTLPEAFFVDDNGDMNEKTVVEWTVMIKDGIAEISDVTVNSAAIYDMSGRKVTKATRGFYIINGQKTLVK